MAVPGWISGAPEFEALRGALPIEHTSVYQDTVRAQARAIVYRAYGEGEATLEATKRRFVCTLVQKLVGDVILLDRIE